MTFSRFVAGSCVGVWLFLPGLVFAGARITEIMYDLPGTDAGREWIEIENSGSEGISFVKWKLFEASTNHALSLFQGNPTTTPNGFAVIADDPAKFLADNPQYSNTLFGSSFSLSNTGETLELKLDGVSVSQALYSSSAGAAGDGSSLQLVGGAWQAGTPTPGGAAVESTSSSGPAAESGTATSTGHSAPESSFHPSSSNKGGTAWTFTPQIYVNALVQPHGVAGAPLLFDAVAAGAKKEPIPNARYIWSFGDGGSVEGKKVQHTYHYPATYVVMVEAASAEWSATDRKEIRITAPELVIPAVREGAAGFIEVQNGGKDDIDLSYWMLRSGPGMFTIPQGTVIAAKKSIPFPAAITGLSADSANTALLYPNGSAVVAYAERPATPESSVQPAEQTATVVPPVESKSETSVALPSPVPRQEKDTESTPKPVKNETPAAPIASSTELLGAVGTSNERGVMPWMLGVGLLIAVSIGGYLTVLRPKPETSAGERLRKEAEQFDIVE